MNYYSINQSILFKIVIFEIRIQIYKHFMMFEKILCSSFITKNLYKHK